MEARMSATTPPVVGPEPALVGEREIDLRYYAGLLWRHRAFLVACGLVGLLLGLVVALVQTPEYKAGVLLQIDPPPPPFATVSDALLVGAGNYWQNTDFYNTQFKVLRSKGLGEKVVARLKLTDVEPFKSSPDPAVLFMEHVGVEPVTESRLVLVTVTHRDPREAALWANTLGDVYIEQSLANRVESARKAMEWLQDRLAATQQGMREAQDKLFQSYKSQDLFVPEGSVSAVSTSIAKLNDDFVQARARRIAIEAALKQAAEMKARGEELDALPQVAADPVVTSFNTQIASLTVELGRLGEKFKEGHPEVQKVRAQIDQLRKTKQSRAAQILEGLNAEYAQLSKREAELRAAIDEQKTQAANQSRKATELEALKKEADSAKGLYEVLLQKLNETDIAASIRSNNVTVVDRASVPQSPVHPQKRRSALAGLLLGLIAGFGLVLARDFLANTIREPEEVERYLHLDLLAAVPRYDDGSMSLATEAYQNLRTALIFARRDERGQVVLVTGTAPQEGKTTTIFNLARLLAGAGERTVVVDCDLRRAQMHQRLQLPREPGFTNYFVQKEPLEALLKPTEIANLFALTAGTLPPNPPALLARKSLGNLMDALRGEFEWVLVDSPPLASVTDALLLARHADHVVLVVQHNKVDKKLVKRTISALHKATPNLLGVVLNVVDVRARSYQYYYYPQHGRDAAREGTPAPPAGGAADEPAGPTGV
jgi:succinoglycan biosynthesis transport protein ExoP